MNSRNFVFCLLVGMILQTGVADACEQLPEQFSLKNAILTRFLLSEDIKFRLTLPNLQPLDCKVKYHPTEENPSSIMYLYNFVGNKAELFIERKKPSWTHWQQLRKIEYSAITVLVYQNSNEVRYLLYSPSIMLDEFALRAVSVLGFGDSSTHSADHGYFWFVSDDLKFEKRTAGENIEFY